MRLILLYSILFGLLFSPFRADATHIVGGEIYYEKQAGNNYLITLKIYRDCGPSNTLGTGFDVDARVGIYQNGFLYQTIFMPLTNAAVSNVPIILENPCFVLPPNVCVQEAVYTYTVNLPDHPSGYVLMHQRCCRNPSIINIIAPDESGATFWTQIPGSSVVANNSNPQFNSLPPVALCAGAAFVFDHSATDIDGDSLAYTFCNPLLGGTPDNPAPNPGPPPPYVPVQWAGGFNTGNQITADPNFEIDEVTGLITGTATQVGQYVMGVCVSEYRNGVLLSTTNRDFQFNVTVCEPVVAVSIPEQTQFCDGLTFEFSQTSFNVDSYLWDFGDPSTDEDWSTDPNPIWTYADTGVYTVTLIVNPGWTCADTVSVDYAAYTEVNPVILQTDFSCDNNNNGLYDFEASGDYTSEAEFFWSFDSPGGTTTSSDQNPSNISIPPEVDFEVTLTVIDTGCETETTQVFEQPPAPIASIPQQEAWCTGLTFTFENESQNATQFQWDFGVQGATSTDPVPEFTYPDTGIYTVTLIAGEPGACPNESTMTFEIYWLLDAFFVPPGAQCFGGHSFNFEGEGTVESTAVYNWALEGEANVTEFTGQNLSNISWNAPGEYDVSLTVEANGCVDTFTWPVEIIPDPTIAFTGGGEGCPPFIAHFNNQSFTATTAQYLWDFGDGTTSTQANPYHIYNHTGVYDVMLTMTTGGGCVQTLTSTLSSAVFAYPVPSAGLDIEPNVVDILEPNITITDLSEGAVSCHYYFGDGNTSTDCNPEHSYNSSGYFDVVQTVTNEYGCKATGYGEVLVEGTLFYAPNAFTPDQDGINDVWRVSLTGYTAYDIVIYNRWGEPIFTSDNPEQVWTGDVKNGEHYAQDGIYVYKCIVHDLKGLPHVFEGHIHLIR